MTVSCGPVTVTVTVSCGEKKESGIALVLWTFGPIQEQTLPGLLERLHMTQMTETQFVEGTVQPKSKKGNPAPVQTGSVRFTSSDPAVLLVEQDAANELKVKASGVAPGAARLSCTFDADLGDGVTSVEIFEDFSITGGAAVGGGFNFSAPQEQP